MTRLSEPGAGTYRRTPPTERGLGVAFFGGWGRLSSNEAAVHVVGRTSTGPKRHAVRRGGYARPEIRARRFEFGSWFPSLVRGWNVPALWASVTRLMARSAFLFVNSVFVLGFAVGCGDDGRDFDSATVGDAGMRSDAGSGLSSAESNDVQTSGVRSGGSDAGDETSTHSPDVASSDAVATVDPSTTGSTGSDTEEADSSNAVTSDGGSTSEQAATTDGTGEQTTADEDTTEGVVVSVEAEGDSELVGFPITLSASGSATDGSALTYSWVLISKPSNSQLANGDIVASDDSASFFPDRAGDYVVRVTAATEAGDQATQEVTVQSHAYDVGYLNVAGDQDSWTYAGFMVKSDGTNARQVGCYFQNAAASESAWLSEFQQQGKLGLMPYLPNDRNTPARIAYSQPSTNASYQMFIAGPDNDCDDNQPPQVVGGIFPTFSPNGQRVAVITQEVIPDPEGGGGTINVSNIVTYKVDGTDARVVRSGYGGGTSGVSWVDNETLTWIEPGDDGALAYRTKDVAGAFENDLLSEVTLDCSLAANPIPASVNHAVERGGALFVASSYTAIFSGTSAYSIWRLLPTIAGGYDCDQAAPTNLKLTGDNAHDYDVSLDGTKLLYFATVNATETETSGSQLFLLDLASMSEPLALSGEASTVASGAHFSANGRQLVWTETRQVNATAGETTYERPEQSRVVVANADGSNQRTLVTASSSVSQARMLHTGGNSYCSVGFVGAPGLVGVGGVSGLLALATVVLRRRRRE